VKKPRWTLCLLAAALLVLPLAACSPSEEVYEEEPAEEPMAEPEPMAMSAHATLAGAPGSGVSGEVTIGEENGSLHVTASVAGVAPGEHGFHVHENGVCEGDYTSAGGHFNPAGVDHACPPTTPRHAGDLGNISVGADGTGVLDLTIDNATLGAGADSIAGKAVILHAHTDDCKTQPTGDAGGRLACGVIEVHGAMDSMDGDAMADDAMDDGDAEADDSPY